jgi:hypothetical protein
MLLKVVLPWTDLKLLTLLAWCNNYVDWKEVLGNSRNVRHAKIIPPG